MVGDLANGSVFNLALLFILSENYGVDILWAFDLCPTLPYNRECGERDLLWETNTKEKIPSDGTL